MSCKTGKKQFRNRAVALRALVNCHFRRDGRPRKRQRPERGAYRCRHCSRWHLTSQERADIDIEFLLHLAPAASG